MQWLFCLCNHVEAQLAVFQRLLHPRFAVSYRVPRTVHPSHPVSSLGRQIWPPEVRTHLYLATTPSCHAHLTEATHAIRYGLRIKRSGSAASLRANRCEKAFTAYGIRERCLLDRIRLASRGHGTCGPAAVLTRKMSASARWSHFHPAFAWSCNRDRQHCLRLLADNTCDSV